MKMAKSAEKFYVVVERNNPQLGTYLSEVIVGTRRNNKESISCRYDFYGSSRTLKFTLHGNGDINGHYCIGGSSNCLYGSMSYYGFERAADAQIYLDRNWATSRKYAECSAKLNVPRSERIVA